MLPTLSRCLLIITALISFVTANAATSANNTPQNATNSIQNKLAALESSSAGRLGVFAIDTANHTTIAYHANQRFPFCSTFKMMDAAAILKESESNPQLLQQKIIFTQADLAKSWNPVTEKHVGNGMTVAALCKATITQSDSTAANLLTKQLGGPQAVTAFARSIGDDDFRLDRWEPELNSAIPGDARDTTTPQAMANSLQKLVLGNALNVAQREQLAAWLKGTITGKHRIRAGVPKSWIVGDKTGSGEYGTTNDIAVIWPPKCSPLVVAIYFTQNNKHAPYQENVLASATTMLLNQFAQTDPCIKHALSN